MPLYKRPYLISKDKLLVVKKYINKYFNKGFIYSSMSPTAASIFLTKKLKKKVIFNSKYYKETYLGYNLAAFIYFLKY